MLDEIYRNSFKEVYEILKNTEKELLAKIPTKFINFIKDNMNENYETNIQNNLDIDKQILLKETEAILSLIYRSYWATDEEKQEFAKKDMQQAFEIEEKKKEQFHGKDINEVFEKRKNLNKLIIDNNLMVIKKQNFINRLFKKIIDILKKDKNIKELGKNDK